MFILNAASNYCIKMQIHRLQLINKYFAISSIWFVQFQRQILDISVSFYYPIFSDCWRMGDSVFDSQSGALHGSRLLCCVCFWGETDLGRPWGGPGATEGPCLGGWCFIFDFLTGFILISMHYQLLNKRPGQTRQPLWKRSTLPWRVVLHSYSHWCPNRNKVTILIWAPTPDYSLVVLVEIIHIYTQWNIFR